MMTGGVVTGGTGSETGSNLGTGIFAMGHNKANAPNNMNFNVASDVTTSISDTIADDSSGGSGFTAVGINYGTIAGNIGQLTLTGANTYSGATTIGAGVIGIGNNTALGTGPIVFTGIGASQGVQATTTVTIANPINISGGTPSIDTLGNTLTINGAITSASNALGFTKLGSGDLIISTANSGYSGPTTVNEGIVTIQKNNSLGTGKIAMNPGTTFQAGAADLIVQNNISLSGAVNIDAQSEILELSGIISDGSSAGTLQFINGGTLVLAGANTYTGGTTVTSGTVIADTSTSFGTGTVAFANGTLLEAGVDNLNIANPLTLSGQVGVDSEIYDLTLSGLISDGTAAGQLITGTSETITITNANTFSGGTTIATGTVNVQNNAALGTGTISMASGTTLQSGVAGINLANSIILSGSDNIDNNGNTITLSGVISGSGPLNSLSSTTSGVLILSNANTYTGGTTISNGTVNLQNNGALGVGSLTMANGTTLQAGVANLNIANPLALTGTDNIDNNGNSFTISGVISGTGILNNEGSGVLNLTATNTYSGGTALSAGTINVQNNAALGTGVLKIDGGTLQSGATGINIANNIELNGDNTIDNNGNIFTLSGVISGMTQLQSTGIGTLVLTNANNYTGGTLIEQGTISVQNTQALSTGVVVMDSGTTLQAGISGINLGGVVLDGDATIDTQSFNMTLQDLEGSNSLNKIGSGTLTLPTTNPTYTGNTTITAGTINIGTASSLGNGNLTLLNGTLQAGAAGLTVTNPIAITGAGGIDTQANNLTVSSNITGPGSLTKSGTGTLTLTGTNSYAGGTTINAGSLFGSTTNIPNGPIANYGNLTFNQPANGTFSGNISGTGSLTKLGSGNLTLNGTNSYIGGTTLSAGSLTGTTNSLQGNIVDNATLNFAQNFAGTYNGVLTGSGSLNISGNGGVVQFTNDSSAFTGITQINSGTLNMNGSLGGTLNVLAGGTLSGAGSLNNVTNSGTVSPGNSGTIGTLNVNNFVNTSTGTYVPEITPNGGSDLIAASGTATLNGGQINVVAGPGFYTQPTSYTVLTGANGVTGQFDGITVPAGFSYTLSYLPNAVVITLLGNLFNFGALSGNQLAVAKYIGQNLTTTGDLGFVISQLNMLTEPQLMAALDILHPSLFQALSYASRDTARLITKTFTDRQEFLRRSVYHEPCSPRFGGSGAWMAGSLDFVDQKEDQGLTGFNDSSQGISFGFDNAFNRTFIGGLGAGYTHTDLNWNKRQGKAIINSLYLGGYVSANMDWLYIDASVLGFVDNYSIKRNIRFPGIDRTANNNHLGYGINPHLGVGLNFDLFTVGIIPYVDGDFYLIGQESYKEHGAQSINLDVKSNTANFYRWEAGLLLEKAFPFYCGQLVTYASGGYVINKLISGNKFDARFIGLADGFSVFGNNRTYKQVEAGGGIKYLINDKVAVNFFYDIEFGDNRREQDGGIEVNYEF